MKILVKQEPFYDGDDEYCSEDYSVDCVLETKEDANAYAVMKMIHKAMLIEGYAEISILRSMKDYVEYWEHQNNTTIETED